MSPSTARRHKTPKMSSALVPTTRPTTARPGAACDARCRHNASSRGSPYSCFRPPSADRSTRNPAGSIRGAPSRHPERGRLNVDNPRHRKGVRQTNLTGCPAASSTRVNLPCSVPRAELQDLEPPTLIPGTWTMRASVECGSGARSFSTTCTSLQVRLSVLRNRNPRRPTPG